MLPSKKGSVLGENLCHNLSRETKQCQFPKNKHTIYISFIFKGIIFPCTLKLSFHKAKLLNLGNYWYSTISRNFLFSCLQNYYTASFTRDLHMENITNELIFAISAETMANFFL